MLLTMAFLYCVPKVTRIAKFRYAADSQIVGARDFLKGNYASAEKQFKMSIHFAKGVLHGESILAYSNRALSCIYFKTNRTDQAKAAMKEAYANACIAYGKESPYTKIYQADLFLVNHSKAPLVLF